MVAPPLGPRFGGGARVAAAPPQAAGLLRCARGFCTRPRAASPPGASGLRPSPGPRAMGRALAPGFRAPVARGRVLPRGRALRGAGVGPGAVWRRPPRPPGPWVLRLGVRSLRPAPAGRGGPCPLPPRLGPGAALPGPPSPGPPLRGGGASLALAPPARGRWRRGAASPPFFGFRRPPPPGVGAWGRVRGLRLWPLFAPGGALSAKVVCYLAATASEPCYSSIAQPRQIKARAVVHAIRSAPAYPSGEKRKTWSWTMSFPRS